MRLSSLLPDFDDAARAGDHVAELEQAGVNLVWVPEAYGYDAPTMLGYLAGRTRTIELGAGILPIYSRTPALLAMTGAGLDFVSGGRCVLGLGASGPQVVEGWHGVPYRRSVTRTREIVEICRMIWKRERLTYEGRVFRLPLPAGPGSGLGKPLKLISRPIRPAIPVWVAALGPASVEECVSYADGWLPLLYIPELASQVWGTALAKGASRRPADLPPLEISAGGLLAIGEDASAYRDLARPNVALYVGGMGARGRNFYNDLVCSYGFTDAAAVIQDLYLAGDKKAAEAAVPDELLEGVTLCGPRTYVAERLAAYREAGVTVLNVNPVGDRPLDSLRELRTLLQN